MVSPWAWIPFSRLGMQTSFSVFSLALHAIRFVKIPDRVQAILTVALAGSPRKSLEQSGVRRGRALASRVMDLTGAGVLDGLYIPTATPPILSPLALYRDEFTSYVFSDAQDLQAATNYSMCPIDPFTDFPPLEGTPNLASVPISRRPRERRSVASAWGRMYHPYRTTTHRQYKAQESHRGSGMDAPLVRGLVPLESTPHPCGGYNVQSSQRSSNAVAGPSRIRLEDLDCEYDGAIDSTTIPSAYLSLSGHSTSTSPSASLNDTGDAIMSQPAPIFGPYAQVDIADDISDIAPGDGFTRPGLSSFSPLSSWQTDRFDALPSSWEYPGLSSNVLAGSFVEMPWLFDELEALAKSAPFHFGDDELDPHLLVDSEGAASTRTTSSDDRSPTHDDFNEALLWLSPTEFAKEHRQMFRCRLPRDSKRRGLLDAALSADSDECGALCHTPAAFDRHLTVDHEIPHAKDVKDSARCAWPKCKSQKVMEVGSYHRHVLEKHAMHWRCPFVNCPQRERETMDKKTGEKVTSYPRHTNLGTHIREYHDPGDLQRMKLMYGQGWKFAFACFHGQ
ncbi:unnamed protein product [Cyclocybe aegerita]|uniref:Uncharacterized protein n=1 Tax=Cyclocybe aegerita TaxID=1973307 RepID=A0A8S0VU75_CYCAE|nr:unnamed protein product [Cyclocybe aegerita]